MGDPGRVTITIHERTQATNSAGGYSETWAATTDSGASGEYVASRRNPRPGSYQHMEGGPGTLYRQLKVFVIHGTGPVLAGSPLKWRIVTDDSETYQVLKTEQYTRTWQAYAELIQ